MCPGINSFTFGAVHRPGRRGSHTSQKARCMRHPRLVLAARAHTTVGNEAGMCLGINRFTKCAPIADWVRRGVPLWCSRVGSGGAPVVGPGTGGYLYGCSRVGSGGVPVVGARSYGAAGETRKTKCAKRTWNVRRNRVEV